MSGRHIGQVEQSHGDILFEGSSCGASAMPPNCQADLQPMRREKKAKQKRKLLQSPMAKQCRRAHRQSRPLGLQEADMKHRRRSNLSGVDETCFFSAARLEEKGVKRNDKRITLVVQAGKSLSGPQHQMTRRK